MKNLDNFLGNIVIVWYLSSTKRSHLKISYIGEFQFSGKWRKYYQTIGKFMHRQNMTMKGQGEQP